MQNKEIENNKDFVGSTFLEFITMTIKFRWFLFWFVFIITIAAGAFALLSDKWYKSTASVFPSDKTNLLGGLSGLSSLVSGFSSGGGGLSALTGNPEFDKYVAILKSSRVIDSVIAKYNYRELYDFDDDTFYEKIKEEFVSNVEIEIQDEGNLTISFYDKSPKRAAEVTNYMIELLNSISTELSMRDAKANREFIEKRYLQNLDDINHLEADMQKFQEKYGLIAVPEQLEQTVVTMAGLYSKVTESEIKYNILKRIYGEDNPLAINSKIEKDEITKKIEKINAGKDTSNKDINLLIPFKDAPNLGNKYLKIYRNLEIQYKILEFITPLYEQAKVEEVRNMPSVTVLDKAVPAERKAKPKGSLYALMALVISTTIGFIIISIVESINKLKELNPERFEFFKKTIRTDVKKITFNNKKSSGSD